MEEAAPGRNRTLMAATGVGCLLVVVIFGCGPFLASAFFLTGG